MSSSLLTVCLGLVACNSGGDQAGAVGAQRQPAVRVVVDTATNAGDLVQFQVAGARLVGEDGQTTGNLLAAPGLVTFTDPTAGAGGLVLAATPAGDYVQLRLLLVPGSGMLLAADGSATGLRGPAEVSVPFADPFTPVANADTWLVIADDGSQVVPTAAGPEWQPRLVGRLDAAPVAVVATGALLLDDGTVAAEVPVVDGVVTVEFAPECAFGDEQAGDGRERGMFLAGLGRDDELQLAGELRRDGRLRAVRAHRGRGHDGPRLLGRIRELRPEAERFVMSVRAESRRGDVRPVDPPFDVLVLAGDARIHRPRGWLPLTFAELAVDDLVKVTVRARTPVPGGLTEIVAREIEVPGGNGERWFEWRGDVQSSDPASRTLVVVPRPEGEIVIGGQAVAAAAVTVPEGTPIERRAAHGPGSTAIGFAGIQPGRDRIAWRGTVTGPAAVTATRVVVRGD